MNKKDEWTDVDRWQETLSRRWVRGHQATLVVDNGSCYATLTTIS